MIPSKTKAPLYLAIGLLLGLMVGLNIQGLWPNIPLHATATQGVDKFAIATGLVKNGVEAIYFLDFLRIGIFWKWV